MTVRNRHKPAANRAPGLAPLLAAAGACALAACSDPPSDVVRVHVDGTCDRDCLIGVLDQYLAAAAARDPSMAPLAPDFRNTQNAAETPLGEGVWRTLTGLGALQRRYADPETGQAGYLGLIGEGGGRAAIVSLRIRVDDLLVSESEWIIARADTPLFNPAGFTANPPPETGPQDGAGAARSAAIEAADSYFEGIEAADSSFVLAHPDCFRMENGSWMVGRIPERAAPDPSEAQPGFNVSLVPGPGATCIGGFQNFRDVTRAVAERRYFYDEEAGIVWANAIFERHEGALGGDGQALPWVYVTNAFRIEDGRIRGIYAVTHRLAEDVVSSGWFAEP